MFCSVPLYSDLLAEAVQLHAARVRERQVRLSFKWSGRPSAGGKQVLKCCAARRYKEALAQIEETRFVSARC